MSMTATLPSRDETTLETIGDEGIFEHGIGIASYSFGGCHVFERGFDFDGSYSRFAGSGRCHWIIVGLIIGDFVDVLWLDDGLGGGADGGDAV